MNFLKNKNKIIFLFIVLTISFILRVYRIDHQSLWSDEARIYLQTHKSSIADVYKTVMEEEGHIGPLYHIMNHIFTAQFGFEEEIIRLPSAIYGTISVLFIFMLANNITSWKTCMLATILFSLSPFHIWYSQEARMYSLWVMLILIDTYIFIKIIRNNKLYLWVIFTIFASLSLWTHLNSLFVFLAYGLFLIIFRKTYRPAFYFYVASMILVIFSFIPGITSFLEKGPETVLAKVGGSRPTTFFDLCYAFYVFNAGTTLGPSLLTIRSNLNAFGAIDAVRQILTDHGYSIVPIMVLCGAVFISSIFKIRKLLHQPQYAYIFILVFIPLLFVFLTTYFMNSLTFNVRYLICILPFYLIFISFGINKLNIFFRFLTITFILLSYVCSLYNYYYKPEYAKIDFRSVVEYLNKNMSDNDDALIFHEGATQIVRYYDSTSLLVPYCIPVYETLKYADIILEKSEKVFYVESSRIQEYNAPDMIQIKSLLKEKYLIVSSYDQITNIHIVVFQKPDS